jgi:ribosomal protein L18E
MYVSNLRSKLPTNTFPFVIQSVTTDGKVFELKKKVEVLAGYFSRRNHRRIQNDSPYSDVTG